MNFSGDPVAWLKEILINAGCSYNLSLIFSTTALVLFVLLLAWLSNIITKTIILGIVTSIVKKTKSKWDDIFLEEKVFTRMSHLAPAIVIWSMAGWALKAYPVWMIAVHKVAYVYMVLIGMVVMNSFIESWYKIYLTLPISKHRSIKGYSQLLKLVVIVIAALVLVSVIFNKRVGTIVAGLGALAAVIMLIFKDAILGLVASIQLSSNHMLQIGDWITMPVRGIDGEVEDMTLTTIKIRNFDKTIVTAPSYALVTESFQNWRGMNESGVRQIKRSFNIDARSIKFPDSGLMRKLERIPVLQKHLKASFDNTAYQEDKRAISEDFLFGTDQYTNLGLFRIYAEEYLKRHPLIDKKQSIIVRHMDPGSNGLPLQIYAYCSNNSWISYEHIQAGIFEHLFAVMGEFDLKVFQNPSGDDLAKLSGTN
jgi:miniconductance mechanosensitive channel